jgi:predicted transcriptional regulator
MKVRNIKEKLDLKLAAGEKGLDRDVTGGYCGDLLSDVMANSSGGEIWLTIQSHQNIVAVAVLKDLAAVIMVNGHQPDDETKAKAEDEGIPILLSKADSYQLAGELYGFGIIKKRDESI